MQRRNNIRIVTLDALFFAKYVLDTLFAVLMFWRLITVRSKNKISAAACVLSFAGIFALNCVALIPGASRAVLISEAYIREMIRWLLMALYLFGLQRKNVKKSLYLSMYWLIIYNTYSIITRLVSEWFMKTEAPLPILVFRTALMAAILALSYLFADIEKIKSVGTSRFIEISIKAVCLIYICSSYRFISKLMAKSYTLRYFILLLIVFILAGLIASERSFTSQDEIALMKTREAADEYRLKYYRDMQKKNENIRTLAHDMKNHFFAIRKMAEDGSTDKIQSYIDDLTETFGLTGTGVRTGNDLIDSIITKKMSDSAPLGIDYSVLIDSKVFERMSDIDICTFFGNALDNAVEACEMVDNESDRFITIKSGVSADRALVEITNSCKTRPTFKNGLPVTSKSDKDKHGIGVTSIKRIAEKYDGMIKIDTSSSDSYKLVMMFPLKTA